MKYDPRTLKQWAWKRLFDLKGVRGLSEEKRKALHDYFWGTPSGENRIARKLTDRINKASSRTEPKKEKS